MKTKKGFSTLWGIIILLVIGVGVYWYVNDKSQTKPLPKIQTNEQVENSGELKKMPEDVLQSEEDDNISRDALEYELEDGEHFVFVTDYGVENTEPFLIFDKIQADFNNSENFPLFSNSNTLKRKLFLSRGSSLLPAYDKVEEDYWNNKRIPNTGGLEDIHTIKDINKNEILVITVSNNTIWSIRHTGLDMGPAKIDFDLKLKDGTYSGFYENFIKSDSVYYLTLFIEGEGSFSLKVDEKTQIKIIGAIDQEEIMSIEEFKNIAYDFEKIRYFVSVEVKDNIIEEIKFYNPEP